MRLLGRACFCDMKWLFTSLSLDAAAVVFGLDFLLNGLRLRNIFAIFAAYKEKRKKKIQTLTRVKVAIEVIVEMMMVIVVEEEGGGGYISHTAASPSSLQS